MEWKPKRIFHIFLLNLLHNFDKHSSVDSYLQNQVSSFPSSKAAI